MLFLLRIPFVLFLGFAAHAVPHAADWPQWRGPNLNGVSNETGLPVRWNTSTNVAWKLALPSWSGATPIVTGQHVFLNVGDGDALELWAIERGKGTVVWKHSLGRGNHRQRKQNMSSPSPVTDGTTVWAMTGTGRLTAFSIAGKELWSRDLQKDYGRFGLQWGYASSPLLFGNALYVQVLHGMLTDDPSYVLKIDGATGKTIWKVNRPMQAIRESPDSYTTPALLRYGSRAEIVVTGADVVTGHDPATGKELWRSGGLNPRNDGNYRIVASPVVTSEFIYAPTRERPLLALKVGGSGDVTTSHRAWSTDNGPDVPTPVTDATYFYIVRDNGVMWCLDARTGKPVYGPMRLRPGTYSSSPVLADGKLYVSNEDGITSVVRAGSKFEVLAENDLDGYTLSSPAISDGQIFLRTEGYLWAIGQQKPSPGR